MQRRMTMFTIAVGVALVFATSAAMAQYKLTNLTANKAGHAPHTDPLMVNAWGITYAPGSPFWVSDNGTGWSTLYDDAGAPQALQVVVPSASGKGAGTPTGIVFNGSADFAVQGWPAIFLFATLDGTVSGWAPQSNPTVAIIGAKSAGAVYTGLAITSYSSGNFLFAADQANNKVDVYDATFTWVKSFTDTTLPAGFAPFGIQDIGGLLYVTFAQQSGGAGGFVDIFTESGTLVKQLAKGAPLNQPWGIAVAPGDFGPLSNALLISNNVTKSGTINAFNAVTGQFVGSVKDVSGNKIKIDQLWGIIFGGGSAADGAKNELFFTAGPNNNHAGLFGKIGLAQ